MTDDDFRRLESKVDKLTDAVGKLILFEERQATQSRHRSRVLLRCAQDHARGQRFPLETVYTDDSVLNLI